VQNTESLQDSVVQREDTQPLNLFHLARETMDPIRILPSQDSSRTLFEVKVEVYGSVLCHKAPLHLRVECDAITSRQSSRLVLCKLSSKANSVKLV
jgi:hypothetical protein